MRDGGHSAPIVANGVTWGPSKYRVNISMESKRIHLIPMSSSRKKGRR